MHHRDTLHWNEFSGRRQQKNETIFILIFSSFSGEAQQPPAGAYAFRGWGWRGGQVAHRGGSTAPWLRMGAAAASAPCAAWPHAIAGGARFPALSPSNFGAGCVRGFWQGLEFRL